MLISEMEESLKNIDRRVGHIEQILPTLATKADLERFATKADLERFATKADLERFATKDDLKRFATKDELRDEIRGVKVLIDDLRDDVRLVIKQVLTVSNQMTDVLQRLERIEHR